MGTTTIGTGNESEPGSRKNPQPSSPRSKLRRLARSALKRLLVHCGLRIPPLADPFLDIAKLSKGFQVRYLIDGGAYHGSVSNKLADMFPGSKVFAFEPEEESYQALRQNTSGKGNIIALKLGLSSNSGKAELHVNASRSTSSLSARSPSGERYYPEETAPIGTQTVEVVTLDRWAEGRGVQRIDILKLDLQGHELEALRGSIGLLRSSVRLVYTEVEFVRLYAGNCLFHEIASFLEQNGFDLHQLYDLHSGDDGRLLYGDALFLRRGRKK